MLVQIIDGTVSVGGVTVLSHIDFAIKGQEKIAVVGKNGAGKTTLLRVLAGELDLDRDDKRMGPGMVCSRKVTVGMLHQGREEDKDKTVEELLLEGALGFAENSRERFSYELEYDKLFTGFGFSREDKIRKLSSFSGGEQTKISLIRLLLQKPDVLLLDEPTNHLDIAAVEWLEEYMRFYPHAVVFVSHDRFFLDQVVDVVVEVENGKLKRYPGNYTHYRRQKVKDLAIAKKAYERQQEELQRLNQLVERFKHKPNKAAFARSRKKIVGRMELIEKPIEDNVHLFTGAIDPLVLGSKWVIEAEHLKLGYAKDKVICELSLRVKRGQKIGIIGDNGAGKTTFLKTVAGLMPSLGGKCTLGNRTVMGYFDQYSAEIVSEKTVAEHFHDLFPALTQKEVRSVLGAYLFRGRLAHGKVGALSGGEKARLVLAELLQSRPNLLLLDEPTNHMDIQAKETLESAFAAYTGTILFVSHDRYFIRQVADALLIFEGESVLYYPFGYEHYREKCRQNRMGGIAARIQAEDQALIAGLRAVPKAERHQLKEIGTEEAYQDWRMALAGEELKKVRRKVEHLWEEAERYRQEEEKRREEEWRKWVEMEMHEEKAIAEGAKAGGIFKELSACWEEWTEACIRWLEAYEEGNGV